MGALSTRTQTDGPLYEQVATDLLRMIERGTFRSGDRIPSVRQLSHQLQVSITTTLGAYRLLESQGVIEARPQSGYFVRARIAPPEPEISRPDKAPSLVSTAELAMMVIRDTRDPALLQLGAAIPNPDIQPSQSVTRALAGIARTHRNKLNRYEVGPGNRALRTQIAKRLLATGCRLTPDDLILTSGAQEAVFLALSALCQPGDTVATESPIFFGILQAIEVLRLKVVEIPTHPRDGISVSELRQAFDRGPIRAVVTVANFSNPLGSCIPDERKRELVELCEARGAALIEDDLYGDLPHGDAERPTLCKAFERKGMVLSCSSFSKTLSPGYRVGWIAPGRFYAEVERLKFVINIAGSTVSQLAFAEFLAEGGYDHALKRARPLYTTQVAKMAHAVADSFPAGTRVTRPVGGFVLWVELPKGSDSLKLYEKARKAGMTIAPGPIFSAQRRYQNFIRLNCAAWSDDIARAVARLGKLAQTVVPERRTVRSPT